MGEITRLAVESLQYDPNYNDEESNESEMDVDDAENSEDEEEEEEEEYVYFNFKAAVNLTHEKNSDYSDDEDMSWKIRKSAAKLLSALFCTRTDYLADFYSNAASVLVMRFKERVESVRVEIISAFTTLVTQSGLVMDHRRKRLVRKLSSLVHTQSAKKRRSESGSIATATTTHR